MKKVVMLSDNFKGEIEIIYNDENALHLLDFRNAELSVEQKMFFFSKLPLAFSSSSYTKTNFIEAFAGANSLRVEIVPFEVSFDEFWTMYAKKINRERVEKIWKRLSSTDKARAVQGLRAYERHLALNTWKSKMDPDSYLTKKSWNNEW